MKVLHVSDAIDPSLGGGTAERTFQLALALNRINVTCTVLCTEIGLTAKRREELRNIELIAVPTLFRRFLIPMISYRRVKMLVSNSDIIHVTGHWSLLGAMVCLMALKLGKPYVYCPAGSLRIFGRSAILKKIFNRVIGYRIVRGAARCLAVTNLEREQFSEYGVDCERVELLPNGVDEESQVTPIPQDFKNHYGFQGAQIILFLGRLSPIKGPDLLLAAFAKVSVALPSTHLIFAGPDGELSEQLRNSVAVEGLSSRVSFIGFIAGQGKQNALAAADLLVVPSRQEAMSLVALEAGLCATPVLLTDQCGFDEVEEFDGGHVVSVDVDALADGILFMLRDPENLTNQGRKLRSLVLSSYTWAGLTLQALNIYEKIKR